jgi:hypothetical protein
VPAWLAALYCATFVGPLYHAIVGMIRDRDPRWLWHLPASVASLLGILWGWQTRRKVADLQVDQALK